MTFCRLVNETCMIALVQAGMQANQFASVTDRAGNITNFTENRTGKSFFFLKTQKRFVTYLIFVSVIRKGISGKIQLVTHVFLKALSGKLNVTGTRVVSLIYINLVNIKNNNFQHVLYPLHIESEN